MNKHQKTVIMYDSPEAAEQITLTGWVSKGESGQFWYKDEHMARWSGCTHLKCDCGEIMEKGWTKCEKCRIKSNRERFLALEEKDFDAAKNHYSPVFDKYFFSEGDIIEHIEEYNEENSEDIITKLELLVCEPVKYSHIGIETIADNSHEDFEPSSDLENKINEFNDYLDTLPAHSWMPGKIRTSYNLLTDNI